ncbi:MAG: hypothetical protein H6529_18970 [Nocardioides sp.]|nr:hypothetical protein [Nocardioides sp.]
MHAPVTTGVVDDVLSLLTELADRQVPPAEARARMAAVADRHPDVRVDLVWDAEPYGGIHYDALLRSDGRTTSLSVTPADDPVPWPLRGAQRVGDTVLVEVDQERLTIDDAVAHLDALDEGAGAGIAERLVDVCLVRDEIDRRAAAFSDAETDAAVAAYRRHLGVEDDRDLELWCRTRGLGPEAFPGTAVAHVVYARLRRDGVGGVPLADWLAARRRTAAIRWHWQVGATHGGRR